MRKLMTTFSSLSFICKPFVECPRKAVAVLNLSANLLDQEIISI